MLHLRTLHLRMLYLRHFIFGQLNLRAVKPSGSYTFGDFTFWMLQLRDISPSGCFTFAKLTFGGFTFRQLHHWTFHLRTSKETVAGVIWQSCNVPTARDETRSRDVSRKRSNSVVSRNGHFSESLVVSKKLSDRQANRAR